MIRPLALAFAALLVGSITLSAQKTDADGHVLIELWKQYKEAEKADQPKTEADLLSQIKAEAIRRHLPVDFYDAATEYVRTVSRRDWKQREGLNKALAEEVEQFDEPIVTFLYMQEYLSVASDRSWAYVKDNLDRFQGQTSAFYKKGLSSYLGGALPQFVTSDKEYVLWRLLAYRYYTDVQQDEIYQELSKLVAGRYPNEAALEYRVLPSGNNRHDHLEKLIAKYKGKAVSFYPLSELLRMDFNNLQNNNGTSAEFKALYDRCVAAEKERAALKAEEATIAQGCTGIADLVKTLKASSFSVDGKGGKVVVSLRNMSKITLELQDINDKVLQTWNLTNPTRSFYVRDTVSVDIPSLADGEYQFVAKQGKLHDTYYYSQYTLSLAAREENGSWSVYVTDYMSGKPLQKAKIQLFNASGKVVATADLNLSKKGFTPLPANILSAIKSGKRREFTISAHNGQRSSTKSYIYAPEEEIDSVDESLKGLVYKNQGAFNPGDTLQFKTILYSATATGGYRVRGNEKVEAILFNAESEVIARQPLETNRFGSASGSFEIPKGHKGGLFNLYIESGNRYVASTSLRVDEFVLPTFELKFDTHNQLYLEGQRIPVSGRLISYSGHPLTGARVSLRVTHYSSVVVLEEDLTPDTDNTFSTVFDAKSGGYYTVEAVVTDATGETRSFRQGIFVTNSIRLSNNVTNDADGDFTLVGEQQSHYRPRYYDPWPRETKYLLEEDPKVVFEVTNSEGTSVPITVQYRLSRVEKDTTLVTSGTCLSDKELTLNLPEPGLYLLESYCEQEDGYHCMIPADQSSWILKLGTDDTPLPSRVKSVYLAPKGTNLGEAISFRIGAADGEQWTVVTLHGDGSSLLSSQIVHTPNGRMTTVSLPYDAAYPDVLRFSILAFKNSTYISQDKEIRRAKTRLHVPLSFTRFEDRVFPGTNYSFSLQTNPDVEALVAVWDKSLDAVASNYWPMVSIPNDYAPYLHTQTEPGSVSGGNSVGFSDEEVLYYAGSARMLESKAMVLEAPMDNAAVEFAESEEDVADVSGPAPKIRESFRSALYFAPHLRPKADGTLDFSFTTSDKLSTYYVTVYVHDEAMRNARLQQEMVVTLPVKVSIMEPKYLYEGDTYEVAVAVTSTAEETITGLLRLATSYVDGTKASQAQEAAEARSVTLAPGETVTVRFPVGAFAVKPAFEGDHGTLTLTATYTTPAFSDGLRLPIPVYPAKQVLTEAHSGILHAGQDRDALIRTLQKAFVNVNGKNAEVKEITILDMVKDAIPGKVDPAAKDVLSLTEAWYMRLLSELLEDKLYDTEELEEQILACRNSDGGFGWFEGMDSSPVITAVVLERMAKLRDRGFEVPDVSEAAAYLDRTHFDRQLPFWRGWISDAQYMHVRALYADVPFAWKPSTDKDKKYFAEWKKNAVDYLTPSKADGRGLKGQILAKARRLLTLQNLADSSEGLALAKAWGLGSKSKLMASWEADVRSLSEYAVEHKEGGWYFPNAVMPWRGLLESEAYAHSLLCDLFAEVGRRQGYDKLQPLVKHIPDGVRLWLMLQKETQKWDAEPAFVDAIVSILDGSGEFLDTKVIALSATYTAPFSKIKAAGNGFTVERRFFREVTTELIYDDKTSEKNDNVTSLEEIKPGDPVQVGEKIIAEYRIWNEENRSFVKLSAGREATLRPVQQLSGRTGWGIIRPLRSGYSWTFTPQGYRDVKTDHTDYYFDAYPEEKTTITEEFFVTQAGTFTAPVVTIESLYAPHYRANDGYHAPMTVRAE